MKKIKIVFLSSLGALLLFSCENLVEVSNPTNQLGTSQVFEDVQTANAALAGLYGGLRDQSVIAGAGYDAIGTLAASYTDDLDCFNNDQNGVLDIYQNQQQETNTVIVNLWNTAYSQVYYANSIIQGAENSTALSADDKNRLKGEALLVRSCLLYTSDAADEEDSVDLGGRR